MLSVSHIDSLEIEKKVFGMLEWETGLTAGTWELPQTFQCT